MSVHPSTPIATQRTVRAEIGPPLGSDATQRRAVGRIGGCAWEIEPPRRDAMTRALGAGAQMMGDDVSLVADWDACEVDGHSVASVDAWRAIVRAGRIADVSGAFAIAWCDDEGALCLARDAIGHRTMYWATTPRGPVFASTIRALVASGLVPRELDLPAVAAYLTYAYVPGERTLLAGVREVLPGEVLRLWSRRVEHRRFWSLPSEPRSSVGDEEALRRALRDVLERTVTRMLPPGEPVGATLSGGLDSSLVVALARRLHDAPVCTFSVSFGDGYKNELPYSSLVAGHCATDHRVVELSPAAVLAHLDQSIALLDKPIGDPLTVPNAILFREASAHVGVVLNGEGGDPCFGGPKNLPMILAELLGDGENDGDAALHARERSYLRAHLKCYDDLGVMLAPHVAAAIADAPMETEVARHFDDPRWTSFVTKLMALNVAFKGGHHILPKVDASSAPFGVLARSPLFDRAVVLAAFTIPPQLKLRGNVEKYLLKEAVRDLLPAAILERPKSGMLVPVEGWFQGPLLPRARERVLDGLRPYGLFDAAYLEELIAGRQRGLRPRRGVKIWLLVTLEAWLRSVFAP